MPMATLVEIRIDAEEVTHRTRVKSYSQKLYLQVAKIMAAPTERTRQIT